MSKNKPGRPTTEKKPIKRIFRDEVEIHHDLFRLQPSTMKKNVSYTEHPDWVDSVHEHFYHTVDSNGRKQTYSAPVGGHFHELKVERNDSGEIIGVECISGPLKMANKRVDGKYRNVPVPFNSKDKHTHEVEYLRSNKLLRAKVNEEAARHISGVIARQTSTQVKDPETGQQLESLAVSSE